VPLVDIPENIEESYYHGKVYVCFKDAVFEPSSPNRHIAELYKLINDKPILFLYCDGGLDLRFTYVSVQLSLIALFLKLDLDYLCVCHNAPFHSWKNPVEGIMSVINLGLQSVGLMRQETDEEFEAIIGKYNTMEQLRQAAKKKPELKEKVLDSIEPIKIMLSDIITRLQWNKVPLEVQSSATETQIRELWETAKEIDSTLVFDKKYRKCTLKEFPKVEFISHCCQTRHYSFSVKKCGNSDVAYASHPGYLLRNLGSCHIFQIQYLVLMGIICYLQMYLEKQTQMKSTDPLYRSLLRRNPYHLLPVSSMPITLGFLYNVKNARCGA